MSRDFNGTDQWLTRSGRILTGYPFSIVARVYLDASPSGARAIASISTGTAYVNVYVSTTFTLNVAGSGFDVYRWRDDVTPATGQWYSLVIVAEDSDVANWRVYVDGALGTQDSFGGPTAAFPASGDTFIGSAAGGASPIDAKIADVGWYSAALDADDAADHAAGHTADRIRPESLVAWHKLAAGDGDVDYVDDFDLTAVGSPTDADDPPYIQILSPGVAVIAFSAVDPIGPLTVFPGAASIAFAAVAPSAPIAVLPGAADLAFAALAPGVLVTAFPGVADLAMGAIATTIVTGASPGVAVLALGAIAPDVYAGFQGRHFDLEVPDLAEFQGAVQTSP